MYSSKGIQKELELFENIFLPTSLQSSDQECSWWEDGGREHSGGGGRSLVGSGGPTLLEASHGMVATPLVLLAIIILGEVLGSNDRGVWQFGGFVLKGC